MKLFTNKNECCGCGACAYVCPQKAISMQKDDTGFSYPVIDQSFCVNCGKCKSVCTFLKPRLQDKPQQVYLAKNRCADVLTASTSGGMFTAISDVVLQNDGVIYSPVFADNMFLSHGRIATKAARDMARGSKYVQSKTDGIYGQVLEDLKQGLSVAYFGTPCQIGALLQAIPAAHTDNLYTVDVICNGVGSPLAWESYVKKLEKKYGKTLQQYIFRPKTAGYLTTTEQCVFQDGTKAIADVPMDKFNDWYYSGLITRPSCSHCGYADKKRVSDITIGDFSKAKLLFPEFDSSWGASTLIINTEKGKLLLGLFQNLIEAVPIDFSACEQIRLKKCSTFNQQSEVFLQNCGKYGFDRAVRLYLGPVKRFKYFLLRIWLKRRKR